jgi:hypothetical protein
VLYISSILNETFYVFVRFYSVRLTFWKRNAEVIIEGSKLYKTNKVMQNILLTNGMYHIGPYTVIELIQGECVTILKKN